MELRGALGLRYAKVRGGDAGSRGDRHQANEKCGKEAADRSKNTFRLPCSKDFIPDATPDEGVGPAAISG